jgi:phage terminase Nu1 subunit (DNA packaging protein)
VSGFSDITGHYAAMKQETLFPNANRGETGSKAGFDAVRQAELNTLANLRDRIRGGHALTRTQMKFLRELEGKIEGRQLVSTTEELAEALGVTDRTVRRWLERGMPRDPAGGFDVERVREWRRALGNKNGHRLELDGDIGTESSNGADPPDSRGREFWDTKLKEQQARLAQLKVEKLAGELVARREIGRLFAQRIGEFKSALLSFERALIPALRSAQTDPERSAVIRRHTRSLLERIARPLPAKFDNEETSLDD